MSKPALTRLRGDFGLCCTAGFYFDKKPAKRRTFAANFFEQFDLNLLKLE
jgi:hypothetical protein